MKATINQVGSVVKASGETVEYTLSTSPDCFCVHMNVLLSRAALKAAKRERVFFYLAMICHRYSTGSSACQHIGRFSPSESTREPGRNRAKNLSFDYSFYPASVIVKKHTERFIHSFAPSPGLHRFQVFGALPSCPVCAH